MANQIDSLGCSHASLTMAYHNKLLWGRVFQAWSPFFFLSLSLTVSDSLYLSLLSVSALSLFRSCFSSSLSLPPLRLAHLLRLSPPLLSLSLSLSLWQAVVWLQLIAVEINKASKFVFLLYCVTQRKGDVFREVQANEQGAHLTSLPVSKTGKRVVFICFGCLCGLSWSPLSLH